MAIRFYKPTSPGRRGMSTQDFGEITKKDPEKSLLEHKVQKVGRNNYGRITSRFRSAGHKKRYRKIDFKRNKTGVPSTTRTAPPTSRSFSTRTARRRTSSRRPASRSVTK